MGTSRALTESEKIFNAANNTMRDIDKMLWSYSGRSAEGGDMLSDITESILIVQSRLCSLLGKLKAAKGKDGEGMTVVELVSALVRHRTPNAEVKLYHRLQGKIMPETIEAPIGRCTYRGYKEIVLSHFDDKPPCCDSPGHPKCDQCQEQGLAGLQNQG